MGLRAESKAQKDATDGLQTEEMCSMRFMLFLVPRRRGHVQGMELKVAPVDRKEGNGDLSPTTT